MNVPRKSIAYNSFFSLIDKGYTALSSLALIPFIVHHLGMETYGIWVVLSTVSNYMGLGMFGIPFTFEKCIAQYNAVRDEQSMRRFIVTALYASTALGIVILVVSLFCMRAVFHLLLKNNSLENDAIIFFLIILSFAFSLATTILAAIPRGLQRYDFSSAISIIARTLYIVAVVVLCIKGLGLFSLITAQYVFSVVTAILSLIVARRFLVPVSISPRFFDWSIAKKMFSFGAQMQVSVVALMIIQGFDKLLIAHFLGARLVAVYDIGSRLIMFLKDVPSFLYASITSRTSELHSLDNLDGLQKLYLAGTKYMSVLCFGAVALLFPVASEILNLWMGHPVDSLSVYVFQVLLASTMANATTGLGTSIGVGIGKPGIIAHSNIVLVVINIVCSTAFFYIFGPKGIVWGTACGLMASTILYYLLLNRSMNIGNGRFWSSALSIPFLVNTVAAFALTQLHGFSSSMFPALYSGKSGVAAAIIINAVCVLAISAAAYAATKFITVDEVRGYLPFLRKT